MQRYPHFFRFFTLADDGAVRPVNTELPNGPSPTLPVVPGDFLRFLVPVADAAGVAPEKLSIGIRGRGATDAGQVCGRLRRQAGETYTEIRVRVEQAPTPGEYKQFALMVEDRKVLGTFREQQPVLTDYVSAIRRHFAGYPYALVEADRMDNDIRIRVYPNPQFRLNGEAMRIGIGTVNERNENTPTLLAQARPGVVLPAQDRYEVVIAGDIQAGNVFVYGTATYVAGGTDKPADVAKALGLSGGSVTVPAGSAVVAYAQPGTQVLPNANRPTFELLYQSTANGQDYYLAVVGGDVVAGNTYQISAAGSATKTVLAGGSDTKTSIENQFHGSTGRYALPAGSVPVVSCLVGTQVLVNGNNPRLQLTNKVTSPVRTVDRYTLYVGPSVLVGNSYELTIGPATSTATAEAGDTPVSIAKKLGYAGNPFVVEVSAGTAVRALARRGNRYNEPADVAAVTLLSARTMRGLAYVAELTVPPGLTAGDYQLVLRQGTSVLGVSNYVRLRPSAKDTALVRFGADRPATLFGLTYGEDGLMQQVRLPIFVDVPMHRQTENLYKTPDGRTVRGQTTIEPMYALTTTMQPAAFHAALLAALKHPVLYVDGRPYRCEGDYRETEAVGRRLASRKRQGQTELVGLNRLDYRADLPAVSDSASGGYAQIEGLRGLDGLWLAVKRPNFVQTLSEGTSLAAAEYELLIRTGADAIRLTIAGNGSRTATYLLLPGRLNRIGPVRLGPGRMSLTGEVAPASLGSGGSVTYNPQPTQPLLISPETKPTGGDYGADFNSDYKQ